MKTNHYLKTIFIFLAMWLVMSGCRIKNPDYTQIESPIATLTAEKEAAIQLVGDNKLEDVAPNLWAIDKASSLAAGAYMLFNDSKNLAVFVAQGGMAPNGSLYTFIGTIDIEHNCIVDATRQFKLLGINLDGVTNMEQLKAVLKNNGFSELTETAMPGLLATIKLGLRYMKQAGTVVKTAGEFIATNMGHTISDILVVPAFMLTPEQLYPWCQENACQYIQQ